MKRSMLALGLIAAIPMAALALEPKETPAPKPSTKQPKEKDKGLKVGDAVPDFTAKDANGKQVKLSDLKGSIVVLDFWGTWCGPCRAAMPELQQIHEKYAGKNVKVLGVSCQEPNYKKPADSETKPEIVHLGRPFEYMKALKYTYLAWEKGDAGAQKFGVSGYPTMYVIDAEGKLVMKHVGYSKKNGGLKEIDEALAKIAKDAKADASPAEPKTAG